MSRQSQLLDDLNYENDRRVQAKNHRDDLVFDERHMTLTWMRSIEDDERDDPAIIALGAVDEIAVVFPAKFVACTLCEGKGKHVNPSIDAGGISTDDEFWADDQDDDAEEDEESSRYARGDYDVTCYACKGARVVPVIDTDAADATRVAAYEEKLEDDAEYEAECRAERRMGC